MDDLISRQAAIDEINKYASVWMEYTESMTKDEIAQEALNAAKQTMIRVVKNLPSAQRTGRWIEDTGILYPNEKCGICSECQYVTAFYQHFKFCPNCGADMRGEQDE